MRGPSLLLLLVAALACAGEPSLTPGAVEFSGPPKSGEPNLFPLSDGRIALTWLEPSAGGHALRVALRGDHGWSEPRTVMESDKFFVNWADFPSFVTLTDGTWMVHWLEKVARAPYAYHVKVTLSRDEGATWSEPIVPHRDDSPKEHGFVSMVPWAGGAALVWLDGRGMGSARHDAGPMGAGAMSVRFTTIAPDGALGEDILIDDRTCECCQTALARTASGLVAAYRDRSEAEIRDVAAVRFAGGRWSEPFHVGSDNWHYPGCPVNGPQLSARGDTVAIAWFAAPENRPRVQVAFSFDGGASFGEPVRIDDGRPSGRVDIEFLPTGEALASWLELTDDAAQVRGRLIQPNGRTGSSWLVADTDEARSSGFPRMAVGRDGVVMAWTVVGDSGGVRVATVRRGP